MWLPFWKFVVASETKKRLEDSWAPHYTPQGNHKTLGWSWDDLRQMESKWSSGNV